MATSRWAALRLLSLPVHAEQHCAGVGASLQAAGCKCCAARGQAADVSCARLGTGAVLHWCTALCITDGGRRPARDHATTQWQQRMPRCAAVQARKVWQSRQADWGAYGPVRLGSQAAVLHSVERGQRLDTVHIVTLRYAHTRCAAPHHAVALQAQPSRAGRVAAEPCGAAAPHEPCPPGPSCSSQHPRSRNKHCVKDSGRADSHAAQMEPAEGGAGDMRPSR